jgi:hypothetical protein
VWRCSGNVVYCVSHAITVALHQTKALLDQNRDRYIASASPVDKRAIIDEIVHHIVSNHGRFLKPFSNSKQWVAVSEAATRLKTAHAIQYLMRRKARNEVKKTQTDALMSQRTNNTFSLPEAAHQTTASKCSDNCDRCDRLEAYVQCLLSTHISPTGWSIEPTASRLEHNASAQESNAAPWVTLPTPAKPVREVTVQDEEDPVDQLLKMRRNESIISLGPMDWSKSAGLNDSFTAAAEQDTIDLWSSMSLDDKALQSLASFSTLSIAPSLPKPNATWERTQTATTEGSFVAKSA